jgi:iron complex outermembrane receptor protein
MHCPPCKHAVVCALALAALAAPPVQAQEIGTLPTVEVTGSRIKRTDLETPLPVQVITSAEIRRSGATSTAELLSGVAAAGSGGTQDLYDGGFTAGAATLSLRGLGSQGTLLLLDGRRLGTAPYASPNSGQSQLYNLNVIPLSAIERIEVLKSGASAIYGSDAVAGVVNIILRKHYRSAEAGVSYAAAGDGAFGTHDVHGAFAFGDPAQGGYRGFIGVDHSRRDRTALSDSHGVDEAGLTRIFGRNTASSSLSWPGNYFRESQPHSGNFTRFAGADARCPAQLLRTDGRCGYNPDQALDAVGAQDSNTLSGMIDLPAGHTGSLFTGFGLSRVTSRYIGSPAAVDENGSVWFAQDGRRERFRFILPPGHPDNPFTAPVALRYRFADLGPRSSEVNIESGYLLLGARGKRAGWEWESALLRTWTQRERIDRGGLYFPALTTAIAGQTYRPYGSNSAQTLAAISPAARETGVSSGTGWDLQGTRELRRLAGGPLTLAAGIEARHESLEVTPDARVVAGDFVGQGASQASASRNLGALYAELSAPFARGVESQLALRADHYSDFGSSVTPQLALKWKPSDTVALRASYAAGFRAPALASIGGANTQVFDSGLSDPLRCGRPHTAPADCSFTGSALLRSNPDLQPETSASQTIGLVLSPTRNFDLTADFYRIVRRNEVDTFSTQYVLDHAADFPGAVLRDPNPATWLPGVPNSGPVQSTVKQFLNLGESVVHSIDADAELRTALGAWGRLRTRLRGSYLIRFEHRIHPGSPVIESQGGIGPYGALPRFRGSLENNWTYRHFSAQLRVNYVSGWRVADSSCSNPAYLAAVPDCRVRPWTTIDLMLRYRGIRHLELGFGIRNILDKSAPLDPGHVTSGFDPAFHNPYGRYFSLWLNYAFT